MMSLLIANEEWSIAAAAAVCRWYVSEHPATLAYYDFGGTNADPHPHDDVGLSDAGRLVVINARPTADDVPRMIEAAQSAPWDAVRHEEDITVAPDVTDLLDRAELLYRHFRDAGLGPTRTHKLLHLKRPTVFPVVDSVVRRTYAGAARNAGRDRRSTQSYFWPVLVEEMRANTGAYRELIVQLGDHPACRLTIPRLADILVWSLHGQQRSDARAAAAPASR